MLKAPLFSLPPSSARGGLCGAAGARDPAQEGGVRNGDVGPSAEDESCGRGGTRRSGNQGQMRERWVAQPRESPVEERTVGGRANERSASRVGWQGRKSRAEWLRKPASPPWTGSVLLLWVAWSGPLGALPGLSTTGDLCPPVPPSPPPSQGHPQALSRPLRPSPPSPIPPSLVQVTSLLHSSLSERYHMPGRGWMLHMWPL